MAAGYPSIYNGDALTDAYNVVVKMRINAAPILQFDMLRTSGQWPSVTNGTMVMADGQIYVIKMISDGRDASGKVYGRAEGKHVWWEACQKVHIPMTFDIGKNPG